MADFRYYRFDDFLLDAEEGVLYREGDPVQLTRKVFDLLLLLVRSGGRVLNHDEIINTLWSDTSVEQGNLKQSVYVLRRALGELPEENRFIKTLPKRGYRFLADVRALPDERRAVLAAERTITDVYIEEEIIEDDPAATGPALLPASRRRRWQKPLFIAAFCAIIFTTAGYGLYRFASARNIKNSPVNLENASWQKLTNAGDVHFAAISPNGEYVAYVALHENSDRSIRILNIGNRSEMTVVPPAQAAFWGASFSADSSQIYYTVWEVNGESKEAKLFAVSVFGGTPRKILESISSPIGFTPDGSRLVYTRGDNDRKLIELVTANAADGSDQRVIATTAKKEFIAPNYSPDGTRILYIAGESREDGWYWYLAEIPVDGGAPKIITEPRKGRFFNAIWYPDGTGILLNAAAVDSKLQQLWYVSYPDGEISRITNDLIGYAALGVSADGKKILSVQQTRTNSIWSAALAESDSAAPPERLTQDTLIIQSVAWLPDDRLIFDSFDNGRTHLWIMNRDGTNKHQISPESVEDYRPDISPDGRFLVFLSNRTGAWQLWRSNPDGSDPRQLTAENDSLHNPKFALGGKQIIFERLRNYQWQLVQIPVEGGEITPVTDVGTECWSISPDGKTLAYSFSDKLKNRSRVAVQSLEDKSKISYLEISPRDFLVFTADGKSLLTKPPASVPESLSAIYSYPISGGEPKKVVSNPPENFYWADLSADGKKLAWVQGKLITNVVMLARKN